MYSSGREAPSIPRGNNPLLSTSPFRCATVMLTSLAVLPGKRPYCSRTRNRFHRMQNDFLTLHRILHKLYFCLKRSIYRLGHISNRLWSLWKSFSLLSVYYSFFFFPFYPKKPLSIELGKLLFYPLLRLPGWMLYDLLLKDKIAAKITL